MTRTVIWPGVVFFIHSKLSRGDGSGLVSGVSGSWRIPFARLTAETASDRIGTPRLSLGHGIGVRCPRSGPGARRRFVGDPIRGQCGPQPSEPILGLVVEALVHESADLRGLGSDGADQFVREPDGPAGDRRGVSASGTGCGHRVFLVSRALRSSLAVMRLFLCRTPYVRSAPFLVTASSRAPDGPISTGYDEPETRSRPRCPPSAGGAGSVEIRSPAACVPVIRVPIGSDPLCLRPTAQSPILSEDDRRQALRPNSPVLPADSAGPAGLQACRTAFGFRATTCSAKVSKNASNGLEADTMEAR